MLILCVRLGLAGVEHWMLGLAAVAGIRMKLEHWMLAALFHEHSRNFDAAIFLGITLSHYCFFQVISKLIYDFSIVVHP